VSLEVSVRSSLRPSRIEVDLGAVRHNVATIARISGTGVCAVVKADAYGHGAVPVAQAAIAAGASWLAVATVEEGLQLREAGIDVPILLFSEPPIAAVETLLAARLTPSAYREVFLTVLDAAGHARGTPIDVHVKLDTGMGRVGITPGDWSTRLRQAASARGINVTGLWTHFARADEPEAPTTDQQLATFAKGLDTAAKLGIEPTLVHAANTAGALLHPRARFSFVRPGIGLYGLSPAAEVDALEFGLRPALRLVTEVAYTKRVEAGTPVSYGHRWRAPEDGVVATLPIGYADGVPRALTNRAQVLVRGRRRPMVGTVTMDQILIWCGDEEPAVGEEVVLIGTQDDESVRVEEWATATDTITYEIVTQLTARLPRHHHG
jgi:alanine racemase